MRSKEEAKQWVVDAETSFLPKGYPLPFTDIIEAKFKGKSVFAQVLMFDGQIGALEVFQHNVCGVVSWGSHWSGLPGGAIECKDGKWERVKVQLVQGVLF